MWLLGETSLIKYGLMENWGVRDIKSLHDKKKSLLMYVDIHPPYVWWQKLTRLIMVIIMQYVGIILQKIESLCYPHETETNIMSFNNKNQNNHTHTKKTRTNIFYNDPWIFFSVKVK